MYVTKQAVRPWPGCKKVKQFNDIKKHQLTFLTCNDWIFTKHCSCAEYGAKVNAEQLYFDWQYLKINRIRLVKTDVTANTVYCLKYGKEDMTSHLTRLKVIWLRKSWIQYRCNGLLHIVAHHPVGKWNSLCLLKVQNSVEVLLNKVLLALQECCQV